ncbi:MAG: ATP-binding cassette domain-containing protein [Chloroflexi bacterium]|nr:ATP-binding cassette domain-containing protein [Chloroflexota bacterium]
MAEQSVKTNVNGAQHALENPANLVEVRGLKMHFAISEGLFSRVVGYTKAVDDVSFDIRTGETLGLVGESGCGKTTVGRCIVRAYKPTAGSILYNDTGELRGDFHKSDLAPRSTATIHAVSDTAQAVDLAALTARDLNPYRHDVRMIFQDPYSSLNPRMTVFENLTEALKNRGKFSRHEMKERAGYLLKRVGLRPEYMVRYPHAFSGGERQRVGIARALITNPRLIVADEAVSALDVSIRAQILNLMEELQADFKLTYLFISHDLSVIRHICDRVIVMYVGKVVEIAEGLDIYANPMHPYTEALMSAVPIANPRQRQRSQRIRLEGEVADPSNPPSGCYFHPRCSYAKAICQTETPPLRDFGNGHFAACHFAEELQLRGAVMD